MVIIVVQSEEMVKQDLLNDINLYEPFLSSSTRKKNKKLF